ncbi:hypothetical protein AAVH_34840 [Aphelenchoides avenae]|nr:hypothetical protein AAVH_34840 [Aphelenchus avenae]
MSLRNDPAKLHEALASFDTTHVGDAFAQLLAIAASVEGNDKKRRKLARTHPQIPTETFMEVASYLDRDTLDSMQLACRFMHDLIRVQETDKLALRNITDVEIGRTIAYVQKL